MCIRDRATSYAAKLSEQSAEQDRQFQARLAELDAQRKAVPGHGFMLESKPLKALLLRSIKSLAELRSWTSPAKACAIK